MVQIVRSPFSFRRREFHLHETHVSAEQRKTQENARFPCPNGDARRPESDQTETSQRAKKTDRSGAAEASPLLGARESLSRGKESFPKRAHLTRRSEFLTLSRSGRRVRTSHFVVISKANLRRESRLGITVSAKIGKSVARNRIKRSVRECFRRWRREILRPQDIVVIARHGANLLSPEAISEELRETFLHGENRQVRDERLE